MGETLTADTTGIADEDGLDNADFSYQWLADDTAISGADGQLDYTLADADEGKTVRVRVSFTDDTGQRRDADQRGHGSSRGRAQQPGHGRTDHQRHGPGG